MSAYLNEVALMGTICSKFKYEPNDGGLHFSIKNEQGTFYIKAYGLANIRLCESLTEGQQVTVLGEMHSYVDRKCHSRHVYIKAETLIPHEETPAFRQLITLVGVQALFEAKTKNGKYGSDIPGGSTMPDQSPFSKSFN